MNLLLGACRNGLGSIQPRDRMPALESQTIMQAKISAALLAAMAVVSPAMAASPPPGSWEIAGQFRPNCPGAPGASFWTYGTKPATATNGPFFSLNVPFSSPGTGENGCGQSAGGSLPSVQHNPKTVTTTVTPNINGPVTLAARGLNLNPGPAGELAVVRFTAPVASQYTISGRFYGIDGNGSQTTTNVAIYRSGSPIPIFTDVINLPGFKTSASFTSKTFTLAAGERLDFQVGFGAGPNPNFLFDSTGLHGVIERFDPNCGGDPSNC